jgi:hypothetical protein
MSFAVPTVKTNRLMLFRKIISFKKNKKRINTHWVKRRVSKPYSVNWSRDSAVGIVIGYGLDDRDVGVPVPVGPGILSSPCCPGRLWGPPSLVSSRYRG